MEVDVVTWSLPTVKNSDAYLTQCAMAGSSGLPLLGTE